MRKIAFIFSIVCLLFFLGMMLVYYFSLSHQMIQFLVELFSIPALLLVLCGFIYSLIKVIKREKGYVLTLGINSLTILMILTATFLDRN